MDCGTPTANLLTVKLLLNSVVSTPGAKFLGLDLKDFYLNTPMDQPEFLRMKIETLPEDVIEQNITSSAKKQVKMVSYSYASNTACTVSPTQESLPKSCWKKG